MIIKRKKIYILELSGGGVKLLECPETYTSDIGKFKFKLIDSRTNEGLQGNKMNPTYFKLEVLPKILEITKEVNPTDTVICVATAWARKAKNISEISALCPWPIQVLSGEEESKMAMKGYLNTAKRNLSKYKYIASLDFGSKSTEVRLNTGEYISMENGNQKDWEKFKKEFGWLKDEPSVLVVSTGRRFAKSTGKSTTKGQHDVELNVDELTKWHGGLNTVMNIIGRDHTLVTNCAPLSYGVYYKSIGR